jgi:hypothetical protein
MKQRAARERRTQGELVERAIAFYLEYAPERVKAREIVAETKPKRWRPAAQCPQCSGFLTQQVRDVIRDEFPRQIKISGFCPRCKAHSSKIYIEPDIFDPNRREDPDLDPDQDQAREEQYNYGE